MPLGLFLAIFVGFAFFFEVIVVPIVNTIEEIRMRQHAKQINKQRILDEQTKMYKNINKIRELDILAKQIDREYEYLCDNLPNVNNYGASLTKGLRDCVYNCLKHQIIQMQDDLRGIPMDLSGDWYILVNELNKSVDERKISDDILSALKNPPSLIEIYTYSWISNKKRY